MGERRIASLVPPSRLSPSVDGRSSAARGGSLPVAGLLPLPRVGSLRYGLARVDGSGVVSNRATIQALGWGRGDRLQITLVGDSVVVHRSPSGVFAMPAKPYVVLPASVRHRGGFGPGEQVLVAADPGQGVLVVHPLAALDSMVVAYHAALVGGGEGDGHPAT
jgi:bifunctional DNA-binding transcriptional regulator/antitoxin component of YhaV-PrlF toxin-antitoxin module